MVRKKEEVQEKILDVDASMQGTISFKDPVNLRINGSFEGKLDTRGSLTIGENAKVNANITGDVVIVAGKVTGDINASKSLSVISPATIKGDIKAPSFSVTEGSVIEGRITMSTKSSSSQGGSDVSLTMRDVSQYLEVETNVIEEWAQKKKIPARFENGNWIFSKGEVDRWIQENKAHV